MPVFLGLDCGGSSCRAVAESETGSILHQGQAGPANLANTPPGKLRSHVQRAAEGAPKPHFVCGCFAGLLTDSDRLRAEDLLREVFPGATVRAVPDFHAVLAAAGPVDVCVIAGTGSIVCSQRDGVVTKSGGRGYILGDQGSAFQYGRAAMLHFLDVGEEGISESLRKILLEKFGSLEPSEVLARLYRGGLPAAQLAKLSPAVAKDARIGMAYAVESINIQSLALATIVADHIERNIGDASVVALCLAGGLWESGSVFRTAFETHVRAKTVNKEIVMSRIHRAPVFGAVELARESSK